MSENSNREPKFKIGDRVILADTARTRANWKNDPVCNPAPGTVGIVQEESTVPFVQWERGSASGSDCWAAWEADLMLEPAVADAVEHPGHYTQGGVECIDAIRASLGVKDFASYCKGNVLKYLWRYRHKNGLEDLKKARVYLNWLISAEGGE